MGSTTPSGFSGQEPHNWLRQISENWPETAKMHQWQKSLPSLKDYDLVFKISANASRMIGFESISKQAKGMRKLVGTITGFQLTYNNQLHLSLQNFFSSAKARKSLLGGLLLTGTMITTPLQFISESELIRLGAESAAFGNLFQLLIQKPLETLSEWLLVPLPHLKTLSKIVGFELAIREWNTLTEDSHPDLVSYKRLELIRTTLEVMREATKIGLIATGATAGSTAIFIALSSAAVISASIGLWQLHHPPPTQTLPIPDIENAIDPSAGGRELPAA